jgi:phosphate:Na+ symporter
MGQGFLNIISIIGSLALFIYGMKVMSEAIQKAAGQRLRKALNAMTARQSVGVLTGLVLTVLLQSSSATTVMVVSFVNAGLLSLLESIGVILGANLGTTVTAWLVALADSKAFSLSLLSLPFMAIAFPLLFISRERLKLWGEVLIGFALLLLGLTLMRDALPSLENHKELLSFLKGFSYTGQSYPSQLGTAILFITVGALMTIVVQSSSAAIAFTLILTSEGWISFPLAAAIVLGENIGTTITANLAATVGNVHAKRSARAHLIINLIGATWALLLLPPFLNLISYCSLQAFGASPFESAAAVPLALSLFHTLFNLANLLLLFSFIPAIASLTQWLVPAKNQEDEAFSLDYIGSGLMATPELSLVEARKELARFAKLMRTAFKYIPLLITEMEEKKLQQYTQKLQHYEDLSDRMEVEISNYLSEASRAELSTEGSQRVRIMLNIANYLERIGDIYLEVSRNLTHRKEQKAYFTPDMRAKVLELSNKVEECLNQMVHNLEASDNMVDKKRSKSLKQEVELTFKTLKTEYIQKVEKGKYRIQSGLYYSDLLAELERIADHATRISNALPTAQKV